MPQEGDTSVDVSRSRDQGRKDRRDFQAEGTHEQSHGRQETGCEVYAWRQLGVPGIWVETGTGKQSGKQGNRLEKNCREQLLLY